MVVLKNTGSPLIEEAYFVLKSSPKDKKNASDMVSEANRILSENVGLPKKAIFMRKEKREKWRDRFIFFLSGAVAGIALILLFL